VSKKKSAVKAVKSSAPEPEKSRVPPKQTKPPEPAQPEPASAPVEAASAPAPAEASPSPLPEPPKPEKKPLALNCLNQELELLKKQFQEHANLIAQLQETLARKRRPVASNGKVQIKDKLTGKIYKSKNNTYQSLLKSGGLKELVEQGIFGDIPEKNTFGWYVLNRACPDRFEEVHEPEQTA